MNILVSTSAFKLNLRRYTKVSNVLSAVFIRDSMANYREAGAYTGPLFGLT